MDKPVNKNNIQRKVPPKLNTMLAEEHNNRTRGLMLKCLILWLVSSIFIHFFVDALNVIVFLGFPLGWYMTAQGSLIIFVAICFWYSKKQNQIDHECGFAEDD